MARPAPDSFADLATKLLPTVVNIATSQTLKAPPQSAMPQLPPGSPLDDLFKNFLGPQAQPRRVMSPRWARASSSIRPATSSPTIM